MLENYIPKKLSKHASIFGVLCVAFCCLVISACGGGGAGAACVAAVGALGTNACENATKKNNSTQPSITLSPLSFNQVQEHIPYSDSLLNTTTLTSVTFMVQGAAAVPNVANQFTATGSGLGGTLSYSSVTGAFTYTPPGVGAAQQFTKDAKTVDTFTYLVKDASGQLSSLAPLTFTVQEVHDALDTVKAVPGSSTYDPTIGTLVGVLQSFNPNQYPVQFGPTAMSTTYGSVTINPNNGIFTYTFPVGTNQTDSFTFSVTDTQNNTTSSATYTLNPPQANTLTWQSNTLLGVYNNSIAPKYNQVNVQLHATCTVGSPQYVPVADPSWPVGLNPITSTGLITGSLSPVQGTSVVSVPLTVYARCPGSVQTYSQLMQMLVLPQNILQFTTAAVNVLSGTMMTKTNPTQMMPVIGMGQCPLTTVVVDDCVTQLVTALPAGPLAINGTNPGQYILSPSVITHMSVLIVGGGGGGAFGNTTAAGAGGGAGGFLYYDSVATTPSLITVVVGQAGMGETTNGVTNTPATAGGLSAFGSIQALGGLPASGAGTGGGGEPGSNAQSQSNIVAYSGASVVVGSKEGGGAGANGPGGVMQAGTPTTWVGPQGGLGAPNLITGQLVTYAAGGAGGSLSTTCLANTTLNPDGNGGNGGILPAVAGTYCPGLSGDPGVVVISF